MVLKNTSVTVHELNELKCGIMNSKIPWSHGKGPVACRVGIQACSPHALLAVLSRKSGSLQNLTAALLSEEKGLKILASHCVTNIKKKIQCNIHI